MRSRSTISAAVLTLFVLVAASACSGDETTESVSLEQPAEVAELTPEELGRLGARLEASPDQIEEILAEHGMTLETYEAAIRDLTENPGEAKRYADAYENANG